jgi:hypothetical protein
MRFVRNPHFRAEDVEYVTNMLLLFSSKMRIITKGTSGEFAKCWP